MYKIYQFNGKDVGAYKENDDGSRIVFTFDNLDNTDYANFKNAILEDKAQLQDADGNTMTAEQAKDFVKELP
jgi:SPX domain protein involved in polyphosphate accumulation